MKNQVIWPSFSAAQVIWGRFYENQVIWAFAKKKPGNLARLEDLTKAMATGRMWTQAQPAERACRGAAAAERRLNGVAYTAPKSRLPKKTER